MQVNLKMIYDIGCHKREDASFYLKLGYKVIAFEADPYLIDYLKNYSKKN